MGTEVEKLVERSGLYLLAGAWNGAVKAASRMFSSAKQRSSSLEKVYAFKNWIRYHA